MLVKFNKNHSWGIHNKKKGDVVNVATDFATKLVNEKIATYVDGKPAKKNGVVEE